MLTKGIPEIGLVNKIFQECVLLTKGFPGICLADYRSSVDWSC